jgi:hypothetical protein
MLVGNWSEGNIGNAVRFAADYQWQTINQ